MFWHRITYARANTVYTFDEVSIKCRLYFEAFSRIGVGMPTFFWQTLLRAHAHISVFILVEIPTKIRTAVSINAHLIFLVYKCSILYTILSGNALWGLVTNLQISLLTLISVFFLRHRTIRYWIPQAEANYFVRIVRTGRGSVFLTLSSCQAFMSAIIEIV